MLTLGTMGFIVNALIDVSPMRYISKRNFLLGFAVVFMYFLSGIWSTDKTYWLNHTITKIPIMFFPVAFAYLPQFTKKQLLFTTLGIGLVLFFSAVNSCAFLVSNLSYYLDAYKRSRVLPTINDNDYIRLSVSIALYLIWVFNFFKQIQSKLLKGLIIVISGFLYIYLHILAAKSGLAVFYIFIILYAIFLLYNKKYLAGTLLFAIFVLLVAAAYIFIPTFHHRIGYISYTIIMFKMGDKSGIYGDIGRLISYDIAWQLIKAHPFGGVGAGDLFTAMQLGYQKFYPQLPENLRLLPHNQFLTVALACGLPALGLFILWVVAPLAYIKRNQQGFFLFMVWFSLIMQLMIEPTLEIQYGIFVYVFYLNWQIHNSVHPTAAPSNFWFSRLLTPKIK